MLYIQSILLIFFVFAIIKVIMRFRVGDLRLSGLVLWILFWVLGGVIVILPDSTFYFAKLLGIGRGADLVVYVSVILLFFIIFKLMVRIEKMEKNITKIVRKETLDNAVKREK